jgi:hypothetical protein
MGGEAYSPVNPLGVDATLTGPRGNTISGSQSQVLTSIGDLFPQRTLKWNQGVNNSMICGTGDIPVGDYNSARLTNLGGVQAFTLALRHRGLGQLLAQSFLPRSAHELSVRIATLNRSGLRPSLLRLSALECLISLADCSA